MENTIKNSTENYLASAYAYGENSNRKTYGDMLINRKYFIKDSKALEENGLTMLLEEVKGAVKASILLGRYKTYEYRKTADILLDKIYHIIENSL